MDHPTILIKLELMVLVRVLELLALELAQQLVQVLAQVLVGVLLLVLVLEQLQLDILFLILE